MLLANERSMKEGSFHIFYASGFAFSLKKRFDENHFFLSLPQVFQTRNGLDAMKLFHV